jgi:hypothetical protein
LNQIQKLQSIHRNTSLKKDVEMTGAQFQHMPRENEDGWMQEYNTIGATKETGIRRISSLGMCRPVFPTRTTRQHIPENDILYSYRHENLISYVETGICLILNTNMVCFQ